MNIMLNDLFRQLDTQCRVDRWVLMLHYRFVAGRGCVAPLTLEPLPAHAESVRRAIEYEAVPLVALTRDTDRAHYTLRLVYHAPSDTYYYGLIRTRHTSVSSTVWWYRVPYSMNDMLTHWLRRYYQTELPNSLELELMTHATANR